MSKPESLIRINTATPGKPRSKVMIIYTGGTFGMSYNEEGILVPFNFSLILEHLPALRNLFLELTVISFEQPVDSSNIRPSDWQHIASIIQEHYDSQDGFVVLHGTDTMAFTASALSFMLRGLSKPVIFTGAQLPISEPRSDARENLITSLEIASSKTGDRASVPEVCIFFDYQLLRGNRSKKVGSMSFDAFESGNYPPLATAGVKIDFNMAVIRPAGSKLTVLRNFDDSVSVIKLFPGIGRDAVAAILQTKGLKAVVLETFGSGNAPLDEWFIALLSNAIASGVIVLNISQCPGGRVIQGKYETSKVLNEIGVIGGADMTVEAALTKLMLMLGETGAATTRREIANEICGELTA
jgi:L-asparaginase